MKEKEYTQGMTTVWTDGDKVVIRNSTGDRHVKHNVDNIFGVGEFEKLREVCYTENMNKAGRNYEMVSGYIPKRVTEDLGTTLTNKYFK